jgi:hypothetical protein
MYGDNEEAASRRIIGGTGGLEGTGNESKK